MNKLSELRGSYESGSVKKQDYIDQMYEYHRLLFQYAQYIRDTDISKIEITDGNLVITYRDSLLKYSCKEHDKRIAPVETLNFGAVEKDEMEMQYKLIEPEYNIFDIGGNIGWYSMNISRKFPNAKIFSFEPVKATYESLARNLVLNDIKNVTAYNFGFSDKEGCFEFYYDPSVSGNASMKNVSGKDIINSVYCTVKRLDDFVDSGNVRVDYIKCDVEGAEYLVFLGGINTIKKYKPVIFSEMLRKWSAKFGYHPNEIIDFLRGLGYLCFILNDKKLVEFSKMDESTEETNFFFLHSDRHSAKIEKFMKHGR